MIILKIKPLSYESKPLVRIAYNRTVYSWLQ